MILINYVFICKVPNYNNVKAYSIFFYLKKYSSKAETAINILSLFMDSFIKSLLNNPPFFLLLRSGFGRKRKWVWYPWTRRRFFFLGGGTPQMLDLKLKQCTSHNVYIFTQHYLP